MSVYLEKLIRQEDLTTEECRECLSNMEETQIGALLALLRAKGETADELLGFVLSFREAAKRLDIPYPVLDIVGTGGDGAQTVNISTGSALLAARCGIPIVKHGNRAATSQCGSADVLEVLGFSFSNPIESLEKTGFAFCFAPDYHPMMGTYRPLRKNLKIPTLFNVLGPLLNPAGASHLMIGVYEPNLALLVAETLFRLGTKRSLVYHGYGGLDELTCLGPTDAILVTEKGMEPLRIDPEKLGLKRCKMEDLRGGDAHQNALLLAEALTGSSPLSETLALNAGVALFLYGSAATLEEGVRVAKSFLVKKSLKNALLQGRPAILAEIKRASPSKGNIGEISDPAARASQYSQAGAAAISVLTSSKFNGSLLDMAHVSKSIAHTSIPVLRKDFILEPIQIAQAAVHGADAVLLIAPFLKERTQEMLALAKRIGLEALVEVHTQEDLAYCEGAEIIAVNQRNLFDFTMHPEMHEVVFPHLPKGAVTIAASGIGSPEGAARVFAIGYDALLVGESLTRAEDPLSFLTSLRCVPC